MLALTKQPSFSTKRLVFSPWHCQNRKEPCCAPQAQKVPERLSAMACRVAELNNNRHTQGSLASRSRINMPRATSSNGRMVTFPLEPSGDHLVVIISIIAAIWCAASQKAGAWVNKGWSHGYFAKNAGLSLRDVTSTGPCSMEQDLLSRWGNK